jgi:predicted nuclease of predicted toxin-antitoxin system
MRFLLDANLSPHIATHLNEAGHDAAHVRDVGLRDAADVRILDEALKIGAVLISQDADFTNLLFHRHASRPSLVLLRNVNEISAADISQLLLANLGSVESMLADGAVVSLTENQIRVRILPIN